MIEWYEAGGCLQCHGTGIKIVEDTRELPRDVGRRIVESKLSPEEQAQIVAEWRTSHANAHYFAGKAWLVTSCACRRAKIMALQPFVPRVNPAIPPAYLQLILEHAAMSWTIAYAMLHPGEVQFIAFGQVTIPAGATAEVSPRPLPAGAAWLGPMRIERLVIPEALGCAFDLVDARIAGVSQIVEGVGALPAAIFSEHSKVEDVLFAASPPVRRMEDATLIIRNLDAEAARPFAATFIGRRLRAPREDDDWEIGVPVMAVSK
jgi:hypothetical protein